MVWSQRYQVVTFMEARDGPFDEDQELVHAIAAQCHEFLTGAYRVVDNQRVLIWQVPAAHPILGRGLLTEELAGSERTLLQFALSVSEEFKLDSWLPPGEHTAEGSYYRIGPSFPDFPPVGLSFDIDSYERDLVTVFHLMGEATGLVASLHWFLDWRDGAE